MELIFLTDEWRTLMLD